ncbi:MAG: hypothetical protein FJ271_22795 [Planctomycetes bacterium]|nr:hypothetical protein [Planctomycetota bacterium]
MANNLLAGWYDRSTTVPDGGVNPRVLQDPKIRSRIEMGRALKGASLNTAPIGSPIELFTRPATAYLGMMAQRSAMDDAAAASDAYAKGLGAVLQSMRPQQLTEPRKMTFGHWVVDGEALPTSGADSPGGAAPAPGGVGPDRFAGAMEAARSVENPIARNALIADIQAKMTGSMLREDAWETKEGFDDQGRRTLWQINKITGASRKIGGSMADQTLVEIVDPNNPAQTIMVPRGQAIGQPGARSLDKPLFGSGTTGSALNIIHRLTDSIRNGTATEEQRRAYALAIAEYETPRIVQMEDGTMQRITPTLPPDIPRPGQSAAQGAPAAVPPRPSVPTGAPAPTPASGAPSTPAATPIRTIVPGIEQIGTPKPKPLTMEDSAKVAGMGEALKTLDDIQRKLFRADGGSNNELLLQGQRMGPVEGAPFTAGRQMRQDFQRSIETWLRIQTGAAATETEVQRYMNTYFPSPLDPPEAQRRKIEALRALMTGTMEQFSAGRSQFSTPPPAAKPTSVRDRYGLE